MAAPYVLYPVIAICTDADEFWRYDLDMEYAPGPTTEQLVTLADALVPGGCVSFSHRIRGGLGCTMDVLNVRERTGTCSKVILRRRTGLASLPTEVHLDGAHTEFAVLRHLLEHHLPVPEPLWLDEYGIFSEPAFLISYINGQPLMSPENPLDYVTQLASTLAQLHDVPITDELQVRLEDYSTREMDYLAAPEPPVSMKNHRLGEALWNRQQQELENIIVTSRVLVHGDYWPGNTLWQGQKLVAVVDLEEAGFGDPVLDVATAVVNFRFEPWAAAEAHFVDVYKAETGRKLESLEFWSMRELRRPMPDIAQWLPSFKEISSQPDITAEELRRLHEQLVLDVLR